MGTGKIGGFIPLGSQPGSQLDLSEDAVEQSKDEPDYCERDDDRDHRYDEVQEAGHEGDYPVEDRANSAVEVERHCWEPCAGKDSALNSCLRHRVYKCLLCLRREIFVLIFLIVRMLPANYARDECFEKSGPSVSFLFVLPMEAMAATCGNGWGFVALIYISCNVYILGRASEL